MVHQILQIKYSMTSFASKTGKICRKMSRSRTDISTVGSLQRTHPRHPSVPRHTTLVTFGCFSKNVAMAMAFSLCFLVSSVGSATKKPQENGVLILRCIVLPTAECLCNLKAWRLLKVRNKQRPWLVCRMMYAAKGLMMLPWTFWTSAGHFRQPLPARRDPRIPDPFHLLVKCLVLADHCTSMSLGIPHFLEK